MMRISVNGTNARPGTNVEAVVGDTLNFTTSVDVTATLPVRPAASSAEFSTLALEIDAAGAYMARLSDGHFDSPDIYVIAFSAAAESFVASLVARQRRDTHVPPTTTRAILGAIARHPRALTDFAPLLVTHAAATDGGITKLGLDLAECGLAPIA